ncbi:MAG: hypothetical protein DRP29_06000 [Thermodesulfobacteriota bacterium]|nr:MAG: hypothetical protein DRP29_06000 [Thermodesulfobacteriota bacterium]
MVPYIVIFLLSSLFLTLSYPKIFRIPLKFLVFLFLLIFIGLRYQVGADWDSYKKIYEFISQNGIDALFYTDPGYGLINLVSSYLGGDIFFVNLISGFIFLIGLFYFVSKLPYPSLTIAIANSYLVFIVAMGYTRQSIAIGILMISYALYINKKYIPSLILPFIAVFFHKSALFGIFIVAFSMVLSYKTRLNLKYYFALLIIFIGLISISYFFFFKPYQEYFITTYILGNMESKGAYPRLLLNAIAGLLVISDFVKEPKTKDVIIFKTMSFFSLFFIFLIPLLGSTTIDRLNLYLYPLQCYAYSFFVYNIKNKSSKFLFYYTIMCLYFLVLVIWLLFAVHRKAWIPYKNILLEALM